MFKSFFKKFKSKNKDKNTKEIKRPESSYDLYNWSETLTLEEETNKNEILKQHGYNEKILEGIQQNKLLNQNEKENLREGNNMKKSNSYTEKKGRNIYYVSARKDKNGKKIGWEIKKENAEKVTKVCETKEEAIIYVKEKAGNQGSTCIIRKVDGSIEKTLRFN